jgi:hypothetical protein
MTADPPPWAIVPTLPNDRTITQDDVTGLGTTSPRRPGIPVNFSADPGHTVSNAYMNLHTDKGDKHRCPAYGKDELIKGYVELKKTKYVSEVSITVRLPFIYSLNIINAALAHLNIDCL